MNEKNTAEKLPSKDLPKIVIEARVRELLGEGIRLPSVALNELNDKVAQLIDAAIVRCKANGRVTIQPQDF